MLNVPESLRIAAISPIKRVNGRMTVIHEGATRLFTPDDDLVSITIESTGQLFGTVAKVATVVVLGTNYNYIGDDCLLDYTIQVSDETADSLELGRFIISEQSMDLEKGQTTFKLIDGMSKLQAMKYDASSFSYPCTIASLAARVAAQGGLTVSGVNSMPNASYVVSEDLYARISDINYRDILAEIAGATASIAYTSASNAEIIFRAPQFGSQQVLTYENLLKAKHGDHYGPVNAIVLARTPQEDNIVLRNEESIATNGLTEVKLANNEIMDDERELFLPGLLNAIDGFECYGFEATTEGHGWYECGDRITLHSEELNEDWDGIVTYFKLVLDGGIKETIKGVVPDETTTDYSLAGGIMKTIYNTEIKVDKQANQIVSIIEEQSQFEGETARNFTSITQNIESVVTSVQNSGGDNLLKNSALYIMDSDGNPASWAVSGSGTLESKSSAEASSCGSLSGQAITLAGKTITQTVSVGQGTANEPIYYSFSCRIKKTAVGSANVAVTDGHTTWDITLGNGVATMYQEYALEGIIPVSTRLTVSVTASDDAGFSITDMMLSSGDYRSKWTQANGEFANTQVSITQGGVTIKQSSQSGNYATQTHQGQSIYSGGRLVSQLTSDKVSAPIVAAESEIRMEPIGVVPIQSPSGWAFIKVS